MSPLALMLIGTGLNLMLVALLAGDKFVHKLTGATPLEARVKDLENTLQRANVRFSDRMTELTKYLELRRMEHEALAREFASLLGEIRGRSDTPFPDDRRDRRKDRDR